MQQHHQQMMVPPLLQRTVLQMVQQMVQPMLLQAQHLRMTLLVTLVSMPQHLVTPHQQRATALQATVQHLAMVLHLATVLQAVVQQTLLRPLLY
jgi:hypothetical protein